MSYDPYSDPLNPVKGGGRNRGGLDEKDPGYHVQPGENGERGQGTSPNFEYGSGSRDISVNEAEEGVTEGYTEAQTLYTAFDSDADADAVESGGGMA